MLYNGFAQRVQLTRGSGGTAVSRRLVSDRDGRLLGEYGGAAGMGGTGGKTASWRASLVPFCGKWR